MELRSRLENILFFKKDSKNKYSKSLFLLILIFISGFIISCSIMPSSMKKDNPLITYIKDDGLYFTYLNDSEEIKIHEGSDFTYPIISKAGSYIAYTYENNLYIYDIKNEEYEKMEDGVISYDWVDDKTIVYTTNKMGFSKLDILTGEKINHVDEYIYENLKSSKDNIIYGKTIFKWTTEEGDFGFNKGIVKIDLNKYDIENEKFSVNLIIEGKRSTDDVIGYDPTIFNITDDGRYIYIMEKFASGSLSADIGGIGVYDTVKNVHTDFTDIYGNIDMMEDEYLAVLPRENNIAINPKNNNLISIIKGSRREMILKKEAVVMDINEDKTYKTINFMDKNLVAMTPSFTADGEKLLYSATIGIDPSSKLDYNKAFEDWYKQPHNIYEYNLKTSKVEKVTKGDSFDFMPLSISKDTILLGRYKGDENSDFSLIKITNGKEELIADNIIFDNKFYGHIQTESSMDILYNAKEVAIKDKKNAQKDNMNALYRLKGSKIGDNSAVVNILEHIKFPEELSRNGIELFTKDEPYGLQVNFKGDTEIKMKYIAMSSNDAWKSQSLILFSLIDNLDYIKYAIDDGNGNMVVTNIGRQNADSSTISVLGFKTLEIAKNKKRFKEFYDIFGD